MKWVILLIGWLWIGVRRLWTALPDNIILFGIRLRRGGKRNYLGTKTRTWITWGDESIMEDD